MMKQQNNLKTLCFICCFIFGTISLFAQQIQDEKIIDAFLKDENTAKADATLQSQLSYFRANNQLDSLHKYPYYVGKIAILKTNTKQGVTTAENFVLDLESKTKNQGTLAKAYTSISLLYDELGKNQKSYDVSLKALASLEQHDAATPEEIGKAIYNIGSTAQTMGLNDEAKQHFNEARKLYESYPATSKIYLSKVYNATAVMHYLSTKLDSAEVYFIKASKASKNAEGDKYDNLLDATVISSNVMLVQYSQGNTDDALKTLEQVVKNYNIVLKNTDDESIRAKVMRYNSTALSNLAVIYNEVGNVTRANEVLEYTYKERKKFLEPTDPFLINILIQMGQNQISFLNYDEAIKLLLEAIQLSEQSNSHSGYWKAAGLFALAEAYWAKKDFAQAEKYFNKAEPLFEASLKDQYDAEFLGFLRTKSLFLAEKREDKEALATAFKGYNYVKNNNEPSSLLLIKEIENISYAYTYLKDYKSAELWAKKGISFLDDRIKESKTSVDSIQVEFKKPTLILLETKAAYKTKAVKDEAFLIETLQKLQKATKVLERRKTINFSPGEINIVLQNFKELTDFSKEMQVQLYAQTGNEKYLDEIVSLHESSLYNRIRSRLNLLQDISFSNVPQKILKRENILKENRATALTEEDTLNLSIKKYMDATANFEVFLDSLKTSYPKYYEMRYATIAQSLDQVQHNIPENTTVIRYVFIAEKLYAFIIDTNQKNWVPLDFNENDPEIKQLQQAFLDEKETTSLLFQLYKKLWQPLESNIKTEKVIVIPDGQLYNLSFESLTTEKAANYKEAVEKSLLKKYVFSYHFSLLLVKDNTSSKNYDKEFVAFAPEFTGPMKNAYSSAIKDSISLDRTYLTLLPQPFSRDLIKKYTQAFKGNSYLNEAAQKNAFIANANAHKIIHIGTHAESNNLKPSHSRLIFAKNLGQDSIVNNNSLYTYEIYNHDLNADLTVLTACETGKPSYQSGEGMISLSHAFTYAGSKSILTSLWKIDEKSSAEIVDYFYENLKAGMDKDVALQKAKLSYLAAAKGRTQAPQYWAGLILIGDTDPITLQSSNSIWFWILSGIGLLLLLYFLFRRKNYGC